MWLSIGENNYDALGLAASSTLARKFIINVGSSPDEWKGNFSNMFLA